MQSILSILSGIFSLLLWFKELREKAQARDEALATIAKEELNTSKEIKDRADEIDSYTRSLGHADVDAGLLEYLREHKPTEHTTVVKGVSLGEGDKPKP